MKLDFIIKSSMVLITLAAVAACKKVIQVDLNNAASRIVIEGEITNQPGPYHVKITRTVNFSADNSFPAVTNADVQLTDSNNGLTVHMTQTAAGVYTGNLFSGVPHHTYKLSVVVEGQEYDASSTMPAAVALDSVSFVQNLDFRNKNVINAVANFKDPPGLGNYYQFTETVNNFEVPDILVFEDRLSDGKYIRETLFNDTSRLQVGDTLSLAMYCIDKPIYNYFFSLLQVTGNNGFRSATPANPVSNISNGALGYFSAHTAVRRNLRVY